jgi:hypothetical protein
MSYINSLNTDQAKTDTHINASQNSTKRTNISEFSPLAIKRMGASFGISDVMTQLRKKVNIPWHLGFAVGMMLCHISPLVPTHLRGSVDIQNKTPSTLSWTSDFVPAIDQYIACLRLIQGSLEKPPIDFDVDRKGRRRRWKCTKCYTSKAEAAYKSHMREALADIFQS